jgi:homocitrate synthase NifV
MNAGEIRQSADLGMDWVDISIPASDKLRQYKLREPLAVLLDRLESFIGMARTLGLAVCVGCEDASRADDDTLRQIASVAQRAGALRLRFADTLGLLDPFATDALSVRYVATGTVKLRCTPITIWGWPPPIRWRRYAPGQPA